MDRFVRGPHPATVVQAKAMPPHPATVAQGKAMPPHPATVVQGKAMPPHPATVVQRREAPWPLQLKRGKGGGKLDWKQRARAAARGDLGVGSFSLSYEQDPGPFDESYEEPQLLWRGDDRGPQAVRKTGFTTKNERKHNYKPGEEPRDNIIKWRSGNNQDDLDEDSAVCVARDLRGAAFFPLDKAAKYIYAVGLKRATSTFRAQQSTEQAGTGSSAMSGARYPYDPEEAEPDRQSAIWQFQELAAHRIEGREIVACYEIERELLMDDGGAPSYGVVKMAMAGIRFKLTPVWEDPNPSSAMAQVIAKANVIAREYADWYPADDDVYISYYGFVEDQDPDDKPSTMAEVTRKYEDGDIVQIDGLAGPSAEDVYEAGLFSKAKAKSRTKSRNQKKSKKKRR